MNDTLLMVIIFAGWVVLQRWVLPRFGIHTCMSPKSSCFTGKKLGENAEAVVKVEKLDTEGLAD